MRPQAPALIGEYGLMCSGPTVTAFMPIASDGLDTINMFRKREGRPRSTISRTGHGMMANRAT